MKRKKVRKPDRMTSAPAAAVLTAVKPEKPEQLEEPQKNETIILTGLKLEAEDGSGRSLELARCLSERASGYGAFFVNHRPSRQSPRAAYCPHCEKRHRTLRLVDALTEEWPILGEDDVYVLNPETLVSGVIRLLKKTAQAKTAPDTKAAL